MGKIRWKLIFLLIGLMAATNYLTVSLQSDIIELHEKTITKYEETVESHKTNFEKQLTVNNSLKSQLSESYEEITKPDGTVIKKHIKDVMNEEHNLRTEKIKLEYEYKIKHLQQELIMEKSKKVSTKRALSVGYGYNTDLEGLLHIQYDLWGSFGITGFGTPDSFGLGLGVRF